MIPNMVTLAALCFGMTAIRLALLEKFDLAVASILLAAVLDGLDGRVARLLKASSHFGAELDSLSDFICFGVAPGLILYLWSLNSLHSVGWAAILLFAVCSALRLARFNTELGDPVPPAYAASFFTGVPAPAAAGLALMPLAAWFAFDLDLARSPYLIMITTIGVAILMISQVATFSGKRLRIRGHQVVPLMVTVGILAGFALTEPWATLFVLGLFYLASIPISRQAFAARQRAAGETNPETVKPQA